MKKTVFLIIGLIAIINSSAQEFSSSNSSDFVLGNGLIINSRDYYQFKLSGLIQPNFSVSIDSLNNTDYLFNAKHTFLVFLALQNQKEFLF